jgi:MYXO-CTERM domain-containing protein
MEEEDKGTSLWGLSITFLTAVGGGGGGALLLLLVLVTIVVRRRRHAAAAAAGAAADPSMTLGLPASTYGGGVKEEGEVVEPTMSSPFYVQGVPIHKIDLATPAPRWAQQQQPEQEEIPIEADRAPTLRTFRLQLPRRAQQQPQQPPPPPPAHVAMVGPMGMTMQRRGSWDSNGMVRDEVPRQFINVIRSQPKPGERR